MGIKGKKWIRKPASLILTIALMMSLTSCSSGETHNTIKFVTADECTVYIVEQVVKKNVVISEKKYYIAFETAEEAWEFSSTGLIEHVLCSLYFLERGRQMTIELQPALTGKIKTACDSIITRNIVMSYSELYKCGVISREKLIKRAKGAISFNAAKELRNLKISSNVF